MAIDQNVLLHASASYDEALNQEFAPGYSLVPVPKKRIYISHSLESFRMVQGFIVLMRRAGMDAYFDWESGLITDDLRYHVNRDTKVRIAKADVFILLATEKSVKDPGCMKALEFASIINRRIYVVHTTSANHEWKLDDERVFNQLSIERSMKAIDRYTVKVLEKRRRQLWLTVGNAGLL